MKDNLDVSFTEEMKALNKNNDNDESALGQLSFKGPITLGGPTAFEFQKRSNLFFF